LEPLLEDRTPPEISGERKGAVPLRIVDPACGSGSFLIEAYQRLLTWYRDQYVKSGPKAFAKGRAPQLYEAAGNDWRLTISEKRRILLTHIFGVDVDPQAVEVTKLSLLLKVLEGENSDAIARQMDMFKLRALPDLSSNIRCGNSLIGSDFYHHRSKTLFDDEQELRINAFDWQREFKFLQKDGGFGAVIGNPPWISLTGKFRNEIYTQDERDYLVKKFQGNSYMPNMYEYFVTAGLELTAPNGRFGFIVPDRFGYNDQFVSLRTRILKDFKLLEALYRAPFPNVTADTLIFALSAQKPKAAHEVDIGEFFGTRSRVAQKQLLADERARFEFKGTESVSSFLTRLKGDKRAQRLDELVQTTSGVGAKSKTISEERQSKEQIPILKGESIYRYSVNHNFYFDFKRENISGRTTDKSKLGATPKILIRKTGTTIIASYDESGIFPEQSLYFTYGDAHVDLKFLLGVLNSRLMSFLYYNTVVTNRDSIAQAKKVDLDALPIVTGGTKRDQEIRNLIANEVEKLLQKVPAYYTERTEQRRTLLRRQIEQAEDVINDLAYELYGLNKEEVGIVAAWDKQPPLLR
ncbi:MAG: Eco57I restriction-modification methylase domain-containing protein, partial [Rhodospirillaceae bacterium]|nr:Eco57I restriction-modification methylase domain-containing protein [Rhodospirillaceae bacterium]